MELPPPPLDPQTLTILVRDFEMHHPGLVDEWGDDAAACAQCAQHVCSVLFDLASGERILAPVCPGHSVPVQQSIRHDWPDAYGGCVAQIEGLLRKWDEAAESARSAFRFVTEDVPAKVLHCGDGIRRFAATLFRTWDLPEPEAPDAVWYQLMRELVADIRPSLSEDAAVDLVRHLLGRIVALFGSGEQSESPAGAAAFAQSLLQRMLTLRKSEVDLGCLVERLDQAARDCAVDHARIRALVEKLQLRAPKPAMLDTTAPCDACTSENREPGMQDVLEAVPAPDAVPHAAVPDADPEPEHLRPVEFGARTFCGTPQPQNELERALVRRRRQIEGQTVLYTREGCSREPSQSSLCRIPSPLRRRSLGDDRRSLGEDDAQLLALVRQTCESLAERLRRRDGLPGGDGLAAIEAARATRELLGEVELAFLDGGGRVGANPEGPVAEALVGRRAPGPGPGAQWFSVSTPTEADVREPRAEESLEHKEDPCPRWDPPRRA